MWSVWKLSKRRAPHINKRFGIVEVRLYIIIVVGLSSFCGWLQGQLAYHIAWINCDVRSYLLWLRQQAPVALFMCQTAIGLCPRHQRSRWTSSVAGSHAKFLLRMRMLQQWVSLLRPTKLHGVTCSKSVISYVFIYWFCVSVILLCYVPKIRNSTNAV